MLAPVRILEETTYGEWRERKIAESQDPVLAGQTLASVNGCFTCHSVDGSRIVGPTWDNAFGTEVPLEGGAALYDEEYVRTSILNPNGQLHSGYPANVMPQDYRNKLTDVQIEQITAYIASLAADVQGGEAAPAGETAPAQDSGATGETAPTTEPTPAQPAGN
jgi:cytochrome c oxidase subunit 2